MGFIFGFLSDIFIVSFTIVAFIAFMTMLVYVLVRILTIIGMLIYVIFNKNNKLNDLYKKLNKLGM